MNAPATAPKPQVPTPKAVPNAQAPTPKTKAKEDGEKRPRAPRREYGYNVNSIIRINKDKEVKLKGKRADYYKLLLACDGKTVNEFEAQAPKDEAPRGWLRFFATEGFCKLEPPTEEKK